MWFARTAWIHTLRMRFAIDVAWCAGDGTVLRAATVVPNRLTAPVAGARVVVEATAGSFERWQVAPGSRLGVEERAAGPGRGPRRGNGGGSS